MTYPRNGPSTRREAGAAGDARRRAAATRGLFREARSGGSRAARELRDVGTSRLVPQARLQRGAHRGRHAGDLRVPQAAGHDRAPLPRDRHPRLERPGPHDGHRDPGGERRPGPLRARGRVDPHACRLPRHPHLEPRPQGGARRRHRHHAVPQSARGRRHQVQPAKRRSGRHFRHRLDREARQRSSRP